MNFIIWLIIGGIIGWLASLIMKTDGKGPSYHGHIHIGVREMFWQSFTLVKNHVEIMNVLIKNNSFYSLLIPCGKIKYFLNHC